MVLITLRMVSIYIDEYVHEDAAFVGCRYVNSPAFDWLNIKSPYGVGGLSPSFPLALPLKATGNVFILNQLNPGPIGEMSELHLNVYQ